MFKRKDLFFVFLFFALMQGVNAVGQEVRVYRPEVTAKNYEKSADDLVKTELTFTLKSEHVERVYTTESQVHVQLNRVGREAVYFFTAARGEDTLHLVVDGGALFQTYPLSQALDVTHLVSRHFERKYDMIQLAKALKP